MDILPDDAPAPRLCHLIKWPDFDGYGFNLHAERSNPGQFIGKIDDESPAQMAGLREGDRIIEVNGVNISNENHRQVVERIKSEPQETKLLVVDAETDIWYKEQDIVIKSSQMNVVYVKTPIPRPLPDSPRAKFHNQSAAASSPASVSEGTGTSDNQQATQQSSLSPSTLGASSLETSDFNDDSIEQQQQLAKQAAAKANLSSSIKSSNTNQETNNNNNKSASLQPSPPPMSPDSGKGDEEPNANVVTIEAEINRQSPENLKLQKALVEQEKEGKMKRGREREGDEDEEVVANKELEQEEATSKSISNSIEPDSLSGQSTQKLPPNSCQVSSTRTSLRMRMRMRMRINSNMLSTCRACVPILQHLLHLSVGNKPGKVQLWGGQKV